MSSPSCRGKIHLIEDTKSFGQKGFRKRLVVLEQDNGRFTNYLPVDFTQDACDSVDGLHVGDDVEIAYRLSGRKWQRDPQSEVKYFLSLEALSFKVLSSDGGTDSGATAGSSVNEAFAEAADDDDVPF